MVEGCKMPFITLRSTRTLQDSEHDPLELVLKLRLFHNNAEQWSNRGRQKCVRPAAESPKNKRVVAMLHANAEDCADLIEHDLSSFRGESAVLGLIRKLVNASIVGFAVKAKRRHGDNVALEGPFPQGVVLRDVVSEEGNVGGENAAVVNVMRIADFPHGNTAVTDVFILGITKLIK